MKDGQKHYFIVNGIKTGFTTLAERNLISSAVDDTGMELIAAVMHENASNNKVFTDTKELLKYGFENFSRQKFVSSGQIIKSVTVEGTSDANGGKLDLIADADRFAIFPIGAKLQNISLKENITLPLKAPIKKGRVLGTADFELDNVQLGSVNLIASRDLEQNLKSTITEKLSKKIDFTKTIPHLKIILSILIIALIMLAFRKRLFKILKVKRSISFKKR